MQTRRLELIGLEERITPTQVFVPFTEIEASQYNIGLNGVAWAQSSTLASFEKLYETGYFKKTYYGPGADGLLAYEKANSPPSILGPNRECPAFAR